MITPLLVAWDNQAVYGIAHSDRYSNNLLGSPSSQKWRGHRPLLGAIGATALLVLKKRRKKKKPPNRRAAARHLEQIAGFCPLLPLGESVLVARSCPDMGYGVWSDRQQSPGLLLFLFGRD